MKTLRKSVKVAELSLRIIYAAAIIAAATLVMLIAADIEMPIWAYTMVVVVTVVAAHWVNAPMTESARTFAFDIVLKLNRGNFYADSSLAREAEKCGFKYGYSGIVDQYWIRA